MPSEAFKALRTRVQFSKVGKNSLKTILVIQPPGRRENAYKLKFGGGICSGWQKNVADRCGFKKPRIHNLFGKLKTPGFTDYFFESATLNENYNSYTT